jgi:RHS repeat-associated protein
LISIHGHPDYGTAMTGPAGRFTLPVEGGGSLIVDYQKAGLLSAQRRVDVPWNGHAVAETVQMISEDPVGTNLHFDGDPNTVVTHRSSTVSDEFGKRSCSVVFSGDNQARLLDERGNPVQQLDSITVRATEFATEASMPAKLPPNSAYTYCVELGVDGAQRVRFDKPVVVWVDNFLGFDVGEIVPVGYFDRDRGVWVPSDNGVVVRLLDLNQDGIVDALDANDDGQPDDLDHDGSISDDVKGLEDPQAYVPGSTYWRFTVSHFSPWDCNWPYSFPTGAQAPNPIGDASVNSENGTINSCSLATNSYVKLRSRVYHEDIPIPGTDIALHYASNRVEGYQYQITVPVSGDTVPSSLERIIVQLEVAGLTFEKILPPLPNQITDFVWNSRDYLGRPVSNKTDAKVGIGFVYKGVYYTARSDTLQAFAQAGQYLTRILTRQEAISWRYTRLPINPFPIFEANHNIAAGWTLSVHHQIHETDPSTLHKGDGEVVSNNVTEIIDTVAGGGSRSLVPGDRFPATEARLVHPRGLAVDAQGNLYIGDGNLGSWNRVFKVDSFGYISEIPIGAVKDICDVAVDSEGNLYVADGNGCRVVKVDTEGRITTVAGDGTHDYSGDGGPASQARLSYPTGVAVDQEGNLYIADQFNSRVRKVDPSGIITTVAGNGSSGSAGSFDGIPAVESRVSAPADVAIDAAGNLYIADRFENRIRKVDASGIITTVAGTGSSCDSSLSDCGDGGPATKAQLETPYGIAVDAVGNLYIADTGLSKVRKVNANGVIRSLTSRDRGYSGDGGPSVEAMLFFANNIAVDPLGGIYVSTGNSYSTSRVRKIGLPGVFRKTMAEGDNVFAEENGYGYVISKSGQHKYTIEQDTGVVLRRFDYDEQKNLIAMTDRFDNSIIIERNQEGVPTAIVSPDGIRTELTIDDNNHLVEIGYPDGNSYQFQYAGSGLMTTEIEPAGNRFNHTYDELGRLTDVYDEEGGHWKHTNAAYRNGDVQTEVVTGEGNVTDFLDNIDPAGVFRSVITDPTGAQTNYEQSSDGLRVSKSLPCGMVLDSKYSLDRVYQYKYVGQMTERSPAGLQQVTLRARLYGTDSNLDGVPDSVTEKVTTNGKVSERAVDTRNSEKRYSSPEGRTIIESYDANTLLTERVQIPGLFETDYSYDDRGRLTSIDTNTRETRFAYNNRGFLEFITDPENHTTQFVYDPVGRVTHIVRPDTNVLEFEYDENGNKTMLVNPAGVDHEFDYNRVNNQCAYITPLSGVYQYKYDKDRRLTETIFPSAKRIRNTYEDGQLVQTETPEGIIDYDYLCASKVGSITKGGERIAFDYDGKLVTRETLTGTVNQQLSYSYDNDFEVTEFSYAGNTTAYAYDKDGLLTGAGDFTITRDAGNGLPLQVSDGTLTAARSFNGYGEIESQSAGASGQQVSSWSVSRDANGRIIRKTEVVAGISATYDYEYDAMGRLRKVFKDGALVEEYRYNANGTRIYEMNALRGIAGRTFEYSEEDHLLIAGDTQYQHDQDGFLTNKANLTNPANPTSYIYSSRGELLRATLPDGEIIEYVHDPLGRRIAKKVNGELVEKYLWQGLTRLLAVYDGSDKLMRFEYADDRMPVAMMTEGVKYYLTYDQVGSLRSVADSAGNVVKRITYDSFGNIIEDTNNAFVVPFGFAGGLHDRDTGLVRFGYRDYDPETGRWTAKDPILFTGGDTDLYGYCLSDPINSTDLEGKFGIPGAILGGVVGGIFGGLGAYIGGSDATGIIAGIAAGALGGAVGGGLGLGSAAGAGLGAFINAFGAALVGANPGGMFGAALGGAAGGAFGGLPGLGLLGIYAGGMIAGSWGLAYGFIGEAIYNELFRHKPAQPDGPC